MKPKTLLFDFGNVIASFSHKKAAAQLAALGTNNKTADWVYKQIWDSGLETQFDCNQLTCEAFFDRVRELISTDSSSEELAQAWNDIFCPNDPVISLIKRLPRYLNLVLASNTNAAHYEYFRAEFSDVLDLFDRYVVSCEVGARKPDEKFFAHCVETAGCLASECLFIDDMEENVDAARKLGIKALVYRHGMNLAEELAHRGVELYVEPGWARIKPGDYEALWDSLAPSFVPTEPRQLDVRGARFLVVSPSLGVPGLLPVYCDVPGLAFLAKPRVKSYRHRFVLVPRETPAGDPRSEIKLGEVGDWVAWSHCTRQIVFYSTFKSGASEPFKQHAQSVPFRQRMPNGEDLVMTALREANTLGDCLVDFDAMPTFERLRISVIGKYPVRGIRIDINDMGAGRTQLDRKVFELAGSWNGHRAFNVVVVPREEDSQSPPIVYFFPRKRTGQAIYTHSDGQPVRWQVAALELGGLIQPKTAEFAAQMEPADVMDLFGGATCDETEFREFCEVIKAF